MWRPISELLDPKRQLILGHSEKKWIRFGQQLPGHGCRWYYSGTNERSQWAQVEGDEPTHWMPMIVPPKGGNE